MIDSENWHNKRIDNFTTTYTPWNSIVRRTDNQYKLVIHNILRKYHVGDIESVYVPGNDVQMISFELKNNLLVSRSGNSLWK